ncbi:MAG: DsbA family protein [Acidimicrobiales bacterium]|nr:DsbA family protein [Acidimicrobiales bacterium]
MRAVMWSDYICPWCYLGRDRTELMRRLGVEVIQRPFELHPEIPAGGRVNPGGGRLDRVFEVIANECRDLGIPWNRPVRTPNSRRALETAEVTRLVFPTAFDQLDASLFAAHWVEGLDIGDQVVLDHLVESAGADPTAVREQVAEGLGARLLDESMAEARAVGVCATPTWWVNDALLIPGAQPRGAIERWITRLLERERVPGD